MTNIEAMKLALEALGKCRYRSLADEIVDPAITALRTAIEAAEKQEPVANEMPLHIIRKWPEGFQERLQHVWLDVVSFIPEVKLWDLQRMLAEFGFTMKVYDGAAPPAAQRHPLTDDEIDDIWNRYCDEMGEASINDAYDIARAIEAAHGIKEKNT